MPRSTNEAAQARRAQVEALHVRGQSLTAIATSLHCTWRTVKSDVQLLAKEWAADDDLDGERRRLLRAARAVEPVPGYDALTVAEVLARVDGLDEDTLARVRDFERDHKDRSTLLRRLEPRPR